MLTEVRSEVFRTKQVQFHSGLNVVLGDENASNSIGKSTMLMVIDFCFGGSTFTTYNKDIVTELGHHDYCFAFQFGDAAYRFRRGTREPEVVYMCNEDYVPQSSMSLDKYTAFLMRSYGISLENISFRSLVGLFVRVWGKDNLAVNRPLHNVQAQAAQECVTNLIKTFGRYGEIRSLVEALTTAEAQHNAITMAHKNKVIPLIGQRQFLANRETIERLERELLDIKANLAKYATNLSELVNSRVLELKNEKDNLLALRQRVASRLLRVQRNLGENRHIKSKHFRGLLEFFPVVDQSRLARVEEFHSGVAKLLRAELKDSERDLAAQVSRIDDAISEIDKRMAEALKSVDEPEGMVDQVLGIASALQAAKYENERFQRARDLKASVQSLREGLAQVKSKVLQAVEDLVNDGLRKVVASVFGSDRKSPHITLREKSYTYVVNEDTGTGTAYASLIVLDLTVFQITELPILAHDSVLFKNIENDSASRLFRVYDQVDKQSFVAIDEVQKYGPEAASLLRERSAIQLDSEHVLYIKNWRKRS